MVLSSFALTWGLSGLVVLLQSQGAAPQVMTLNPQQVIGMINEVLGWGQKLGIAVGALTFLINGFQFLFAWGATRSMQGAQETLKHGAFGLALVLGCYVIPNLMMAAASATPAS
jgi:hypothetical protein